MGKRTRGLDLGFWGAHFSPCRTWRYALWRVWDRGKPRAMFVGLNPSTADETQDDPTVRRCIGFARAWGFGGIRMMNLFAFRATDPREMMAADDPVGPENDAWLLEQAAGAIREGGVVVSAWGTHGAFQGRAEAVQELLREFDLKCLGLTQGGHPRHPLYLKADTPLREFSL